MLELKLCDLQFNYVEIENLDFELDEDDLFILFGVIFVIIFIEDVLCKVDN